MINVLARFGSFSLPVIERRNTRRGCGEYEIMRRRAPKINSYASKGAWSRSVAVFQGNVPVRVAQGSGPRCDLPDASYSGFHDGRRAAGDFSCPPARVFDWPRALHGPPAQFSHVVWPPGRGITWSI